MNLSDRLSGTRAGTAVRWWLRGTGAGFWVRKTWGFWVFLAVLAGGAAIGPAAVFKTLLFLLAFLIVLSFGCAGAFLLDDWRRRTMAEWRDWQEDRAPEAGGR